jgi:hypothetical protein
MGEYNFYSIQGVYPQINIVTNASLVGANCKDETTTTTLQT